MSYIIMENITVVSSQLGHLPETAIPEAIFQILPVPLAGCVATESDLTSLNLTSPTHL